MKQFFTLKHYALLGLVLFSAGAAIGQAATTCNFASGTCFSGNPTENFNSGANGYIGGNGITYNSGSNGNGYFDVSSTGAQTSYTITSPAFLGTNTTKAGFTLAGTVNLASVRVDIVNNTSTSTIYASCSQNFSNGSTSVANNIGAVCFTLTDADVNSKNIRFIVTLTTKNTGQGGSGGTLTFDDFRTTLAQATTTPVTFASFEGKKTNKGTELTWTTAGEHNVNRYEVERSNSGIGYVKIGSLPAAGNTTYTFTDEAETSNTVFYRIKNVDNDGQSAYSKVLSFRGNGSGSDAVRVIPTLVSNSAKVQHPAATSSTIITLSGADGRLVRTLRPAVGALQTPVEMSGLRPGLYLLKWNDGAGNTVTTKVVKQ